MVQALAELDRQNRYVLLVQGRALPFGAGTAKRRNPASGLACHHIREVRTWLDEKWWNRLWHRLRLPIPVECAIGRVDLFHSPDFTLPPVLPGTRTLVTLHDLSFVRLPHCFPPTLHEYLMRNVPLAARRADLILADSEHTRRDVIELLGVTPQRVRTVYPGVEPRFCPIADADTLQAVREKYHLPSQFILSVGTVQPRKNYAALISALARLPHADIHLVIVGGRGWLYQDIFARVDELGLQERVHFVGFAADADLPAIYNLAQVFALPTLYEGFGLPPLEAMACGVPVLTSDNSSLPEVVGDAGLMVDAGDMDALTDALTRLLDDADLRRTLIERGLARARRFTWQDTARQVLQAYQDMG